MVVRWLPLLKDRGNKTLGTKAGAAVNIEDMFSTYVYTGNSATQNIVNGIDLATDGGMVWIKQRNGVYKNLITDTVRGGSTQLVTNTTAISDGYTNITFNSNGMSLANNPEVNSLNNTFASWTFKKQPRFFDMVMWEGDFTTNRTFNHDLGTDVGMMIVKAVDSTDPWYIYHSSLANTQKMHFTTAAVSTDPDAWNSTTPTSTQFTIGENTNQAGTYIAYLFAHDPLGPSGDGSDGMIACGSYVGNGVADGTEIDLGWEPQYVMIKPITVADDWRVFDNIRGVVTTGNDNILKANSSGAETNTDNVLEFNSTGFKLTTTNNNGNGSGQTYIYMAIRRGMSVCSGA